jgi:hypothetical protein
MLIPTPLSLWPHSYSAKAEDPLGSYFKGALPNLFHRQYKGFTKTPVIVSVRINETASEHSLRVLAKTI